MVAYLGGKARLGPSIAAVLAQHRQPGQLFLEPFCGACGVTVHVPNPRSCSDASVELIALLRAVQSGWVPPGFVPEWYYERAKAGGLSPAMRAFVLFGCSFGGKWCGGYARSKRQDYAASARRSLIRKAPAIQGVDFRPLDYKWLEPTGALVYCDPPYDVPETSYSGVERFDHAAFWTTVRKWSRTNTVIVSEYNAPRDFEVIAEWPRKLKLQNAFTSKDRVERLYRWRGSRRRPLLGRRPLLL